MTNSDIILSAVCTRYSAAERHQLVAQHYTAAQISSTAAGIKPAPGTDPAEDFDPIEAAESILCADLFHTFDFWKSNGLSVKRGEKAALTCRLWKYKNEKKPHSPDADPLTKSADEQDSGDYYKSNAYLFGRWQVEKRTPAPAGRFKSADEIRAYNKMLADQRKAAKSAAVQAASIPAPIITEERHELPELVHASPLPTKKAAKKSSNPAAPNSAKKPATTKSAPQKSAQPAPDALRTAQQAERKAKAAFLAVPVTDRKAQAAALDAWRKTRKAVEDAKSAPAAVAALDEAPVKQLDFESIAAGLLA